MRGRSLLWAITVPPSLFATVPTPVSSFLLTSASASRAISSLNCDTLGKIAISFLTKSHWKALARTLRSYLKPAQKPSLLIISSHRSRWILNQSVKTVKLYTSLRAAMKLW
ncbi:hypothetical protein MJO29_013892 [Puccinia striiformis f. sp. tritici]|nr:hypothetical protein MJO29_013892 [Puccinia striiformis f. sp. tritici]